MTSRMAIPMTTSPNGHERPGPRSLLELLALAPAHPIGPRQIVARTAPDKEGRTKGLHRRGVADLSP